MVDTFTNNEVTTCLKLNKLEYMKEFGTRTASMDSDGKLTAKAICTKVNSRKA